jgi:hypothetical protein
MLDPDNGICSAALLDQAADVRTTVALVSAPDDAVLHVTTGVRCSAFSTWS